MNALPQTFEASAGPCYKTLPIENIQKHIAKDLCMRCIYYLSMEYVLGTTDALERVHCVHLGELMHETLTKNGRRLFPFRQSSHRSLEAVN